jgi:predicted DNA-binding transcriptional regulator AlpA
MKAFADKAKTRSIDVGPQQYPSNMSSHNAFKPLSKEDLAEVLGVSTRTVENWVNDGVLPPPTKLGNRVYWHPVNFYDWLGNRLSGKSATVDAQPESSTTVVEPECGSVKVRSQPATVKTELSKVRNRTQSQLEKLMA